MPLSKVLGDLFHYFFLDIFTFVVVALFVLAVILMCDLLTLHIMCVLLLLGSGVVVMREGPPTQRTNLTYTINGIPLKVSFFVICLHKE